MYIYTFSVYAHLCVVPVHPELLDCIIYFLLCRIQPDVLLTPPLWSTSPLLSTQHIKLALLFIILLIKKHANSIPFHSPRGSLFVCVNSSVLCFETRSSFSLPNIVPAIERFN